MKAHRIALIHALEESILPIRAAFRAHWPQAQTVDVLDTSLSADLAATGQLDAAMADRFLTLGRYAAKGSGAYDTKAILFTCSAFGPAIAAVKADLPIPVMRPNEAAFAEALTLGHRIGLVVTFAPSLPSLSRELHEMARDAGIEVEITPIHVEGALDALKAGDGAAHDAAVARACAGLPPLDALVLGQFSLARAARVLNPACPVLTTPDCAVRSLRALCTAEQGRS